jgi:hypothetical protein
MTLACLQVRRLVAGFPPREPGLDPESGHVLFMVEKWQWGRIYTANSHSTNCPIFTNFPIIDGMLIFSLNNKKQTEVRMEATSVSLLGNRKHKDRLDSRDKTLSMFICHSLGLLYVGEVV